MKIDFKISGAYQEFCIICHAPNPREIKENDKVFYLCNICGNKSPRLIVIDPKIIWSIDPATKEYWHESVGIFIFNQEGKILFFQRSKFPFVLTVPAGHLDVSESVQEAVVREVREETDIEIKNIKLFCEENLIGDQCRRGADNHKWHLFIGMLDGPAQISINANEGAKAMWLTLAEAKKLDISFPVKYFIEKYGEKLYRE